MKHKVETFLYTKDKSKYPKWFREALRDGICFFVGDDLVVDTPEGFITVDYLDWIIKDNDDIYVQKDDDFRKIYNELNKKIMEREKEAK